MSSSTGSSTHLLRSFYQCWCDVDASRLYKEVNKQANHVLIRLGNVKSVKKCEKNQTGH